MAAAARMARKRFIVPPFWARATALVYASPSLSARHTRLAREGHEPHREHAARGDGSVRGFLHHRELLVPHGIPDRDDDASAGAKLAHEGRGNVARARGDEDRVEGRARRNSR